MRASVFLWPALVAGLQPIEPGQFYGSGSPSFEGIPGERPGVAPSPAVDSGTSLLSSTPVATDMPQSTTTTTTTGSEYSPCAPQNPYDAIMCSPISNNSTSPEELTATWYTPKDMYNCTLNVWQTSPSDPAGQAANKTLLVPTDDTCRRSQFTWKPSMTDFNWSGNASSHDYYFVLTGYKPGDSTALNTNAPLHVQLVVPQNWTTTTTPSAASDAPKSTFASADSQPSSQAASAPAASGMSNSAKIGLGVGLGVGIPLLAAITAGLILCRRRRKSTHPNKQVLEPMVENGSSHEDVAMAGYMKSMDATPALPPLPRESKRSSKVAQPQQHLAPISTMPTPRTGVETSPVSPLSNRSSVSSMSTMGNGRSLTMTSEHHSEHR